jgi:hypothetical protein
MKINGKPLVQECYKRIQLARGVELLLAPLPPAWNDRIRALGLFDWPAPPKVPLMHKERPVVNKATGRIEMIDNEQDETYRRKFREVSRRTQMLRLAAHLRRDSNVQLESVEPTTNSKEDWTAYADSLKSEFCHPEYGFTDNEIAEILEHAEKLDAVIDMDEATKDFLPTT